MSGPREPRRGRTNPGGLLRTAPTAAGWVVGLVVTALVLLGPLAGVGYRSPSVRLVLDWVDACIALLAAYLVSGRFARQRRLQDLLLTQGLVLLGVSFAASYVAGLLKGVDPGTLDVWLPLTVRILGALWIAAAALVGPRWVTRPAWRHLSVAGPLLAIGAAALILWLARSQLPVALDPGYIPGLDPRLLVASHPLLTIGQGLTAVGFFVASVAFGAQSARRDDELLRWLGPAFALAGFARVNFLFFPSLYTDWLYTGDLLRTGCYLLLLVGAAREMRQYWTSHARAAVLEDRRRLARELHDGVIQELAYIRSQSFALPATDPHRELILHSCDRALDEARAAVHALGRASDEPLGFVLHRAARELAERYQVSLEVELDDSVNAAPEQQHALMRITREAVSNAIRHGKAQRVRLQLGREGEGRRLAILDDGRGFDTSSAGQATGYGLVSMRDRARALPGSFSIEAEAGRGSVVTVTW